MLDVHKHDRKMQTAPRSKLCSTDLKPQHASHHAICFGLYYLLAAHVKPVLVHPGQHKVNPFSHTESAGLGAVAVICSCT